MAIKTTWTEVNQIIKEEFQRLVEKKKIQSRIQQINEELAHMEEEDSALMEDEHLEEVEAGSEMKVRSHAWTGEEDGDTKWTPKFDDSKAPALMEDDEMEMEDEDGDDIDLAEEFSELGAKIEAKIMAALGKAEEGEDEEFEEVEVEEEDVDTEEAETDTEAEEADADTEEDDVDTMEEMSGGKMESINESVSRKDKRFLNVLSEGLDTRKKSALESEVERMRRLANLGGNND
jgi:hypothetical protein